MIQCVFENGSTNSLRHVTVGCIMLNSRNEILLAKRSMNLLEAGKWCLLGGYMERDETTVECCIREAEEESGWTIKNIQLLRFNDNPNRPKEDRQNVEFVYFAQVDKLVGIPDDESSELKWFKLDQLPNEDEMAFDHLDNIDVYKDKYWTKAQS